MDDDRTFSPYYLSYMRSVSWDLRRRAALEDAGFCCQRCGADDEVLQVHHLTYARLGNELPSDLKVVCEPCHEIEDRERQELASKHREFRRWAAEAFGPDWRTLNRDGYVEREFAMHLEMLSIDVAPSGVLPPEPRWLSAVDLLTYEHPPSRPAERQPLVSERKRREVLAMSDALVARGEGR